MSPEVCKETKIQLIAIIAGILLLVGAFLPWFIVGNDETNFELNWKGIEKDGEELEVPSGQLAMQSLFWGMFILFGIMMILSCYSDKLLMTTTLLISYLVYFIIFSYLYLIALPSLEESLQSSISYGYYLFIFGLVLYLMNVYQLKKDKEVKNNGKSDN